MSPFRTDWRQVTHPLSVPSHRKNRTDNIREHTLLFPPGVGSSTLLVAPPSERKGKERQRSSTGGRRAPRGTGVRRELSNSAPVPVPVQLSLSWTGRGRRRKVGGPAERDTESCRGREAKGRSVTDGPVRSAPLRSARPRLPSRGSVGPAAEVEARDSQRAILPSPRSCGTGPGGMESARATEASGCGSRRRWPVVANVGAGRG
ncbi:hypothetical protein Mp_3g13240 [Marchantia polymorpha subsp. ruderalis]|uniref:Uncharacterized protein n=2 Tax=Marchantia polymorpha TaxID=3197 RepID=A0AAF6B0C5_MARPO|nr:hypothetical protein MARPO_0050s0116 [Marchantia polymorpha]BBN05459.1 hypothetical protein Mp_3g13240 [Marchantia polymorpha subsp. ruderalis]|eukprot:PTQ38673.1 hypothetical protein MARPO_0050s0116 [Marchantia polymorpha]